MDASEAPFTEFSEVNKDRSYWRKSLRYLRFLLFIFLSSLAALLGIGWRIKRESRGSHRILSRPGWPDVVFAFHPKMLARIKKRTGLTPNDL
jgi:predicted RNA binding protein YcfA (HicA-like mRNA interferase family)